MSQSKFILCRQVRCSPHDCLRTQVLYCICCISVTGLHQNSRGLNIGASCDSTCSQILGQYFWFYESIPMVSACLAPTTFSGGYIVCRAPSSSSPDTQKGPGLPIASDWVLQRFGNPDPIPQSGTDLKINLHSRTPRRIR